MKNNPEILLEVKNSLYGNIISLFINTFYITALLIISTIIPNFIFKIFLIIIRFVFIYNLSNLLLFKKLIFTNKGVITNYFSIFKLSKIEISLDYKDMEYEFWERTWSTRLTLWEKNKKMKTRWFYSFDLLGYNRNSIQKIKKILSENI